MCPYKHLSINERESLLILVKSNKSITEIAKIMGRSKSTISRELQRNSDKQGYSCVKAQEKYHERRKACKRHRLFENERLKAKVLELFQGRQWSPEQVSHRSYEGRLNVLFAFCKKNQKADGASALRPTVQIFGKINLAEEDLNRC